MSNFAREPVVFWLTDRVRDKPDCTTEVILVIIKATSIGYRNLNEPRYEKTGFLHMRKQSRRSASQ